MAVWHNHLIDNAAFDIEETNSQQLALSFIHAVR